MRTRTLILSLLCCLAANTATAYPPAPYYRIYGSVRDDHGRPLPSDIGTVVLSGIYSALGFGSLSGSGVTSVTMLNGGSGFTSVPTVTFIGGAGTGAIGVAVLTNGVVTGVNVTTAGTGYTAPVTVGFSGGGAPPLEILRAPSDTTIGPGVNYSLAVPMDSGTTAQLYEVTAMRPLLPFTIKVLINGVSYVPLQIAGATTTFWKNLIDQSNSPGISSQGNHWAVGLPAGKLRLDLWLGIDSNNDGLPDEWQWDVVYSDPSGQLTDFSQVDPNADFSGNGMTNLQKFITGVYALEALDGLNFVPISKSNGVAKLRFQAITGRTYHIAFTSDLKTPYTNPQPFSLNSDGTTNAGSYYQSDGVRLVEIYVPVGSSPTAIFKLYAQ